MVDTRCDLNADTSRFSVQDAVLNAVVTQQEGGAAPGGGGG